MSTLDGPLARQYRPHIRPAMRDTTSDDATQTTPHVARLHHLGRAAWPQLALDLPAFAAHLARHTTPAAAGPDEQHAADLYLACACHLRVPGSPEALQAHHGAPIEAALRGHNVSPAHRDDLRQLMWEKLLVGRPDAPPKIAAYAGRGPLGGWLRVAAARMALNFLDRNRHDHLNRGVELDEARHPATPDPELSFLQSHYQDHVQQALRGALAGLATDERNVLRLYFLDRLSIDRIAAVYGIHRATAARWVTRGRAALLQGTQALLERQFGVASDEIASILGLVQSKLELSLSGLFRPGAAPPAP